MVERQFDDRYHVLKAKMPVLITALSELNEPRYMTPGGIFDAYDKEVTVFSREIPLNLPSTCWANVNTPLYSSVFCLINDSFLDDMCFF